MNMRMPPNKSSSVNGGGEDATDDENEMSGAESDHSGSSRADNGRGGDSTENDELDSDDSSEMDIEECLSRRVELGQSLSRIEQQFNGLREEYYQERIQQIDKQLAEIRSGKSPEYLVPLQKLQEEMNVRTDVAGILKRLRLTNIRNTSEAEEQAAFQNYESEKKLAHDMFHDELIDKIRKLEEDRHNVELKWGESNDYWSDTNSKSKNASPRRKAVTVVGPYIVYMLRNHEIQEDWAAIKKAMKRTRVNVA